MEETSYPVYLNLNIPWISRTFYWLFWACVFVLFLFMLYMLPSAHSSAEMKAAYFVLTTTEYQKELFVFALSGAPIFFLLYRLSKFRRQAILTLLPAKIEIAKNKIVTSYSLNEITRIECTDLMVNGFPKGELRVNLTDRDETITSVTLIDYSQSDQLMKALLAYDNVKFNLTSFLSNTELLDETME
jgi:hypothetical protein